MRLYVIAANIHALGSLNVHATTYQPMASAINPSHTLFRSGSEKLQISVYCNLSLPRALINDA